MSSKEKYLKPEVIRQISRLDLKAKFIVEGFIAGLHQSPYKGFSVEFSSHRRYVAGDEISFIDWGVWARTDKYYIKQFKAETNQQCFILLDTSLSMDYRYRQDFSKLEYAICVAASLGYLMIHQQDALGMLTFDQKVTSHIKASSKRSHLSTLLSELTKIQPTSPSNFSQALHEAAERIRRRGIILLFSDFIPTPREKEKENPLDRQIAELKRVFQHFRSRGQDVIVFQILDESEAKFTFPDPMRFQDPESELVIEADPGVKPDYLEVLKEYQERLKKICLQNNMDFVPLHTGQNFDKALMSFLMKRKAKF